MAITTAAVTTSITVALTEAGVGLSTAFFIAETSVALAQGIAIAAALSYGASLLIPTPTLNSTAQKQVYNQAVPNRLKFYGEVKVGGPRAFFSDKDGYLYQVVMLNAGAIEDIVIHWMGSDILTLDPDGNAVLPDRYTFHGHDFVTIKVGYGSIGQEAFELLMSVFPEWTADHRLCGVACVLIRLRSPEAENFSRIYPTGLPRYNAVMHSTRVWDPRDVGTDIDDSDTDGTITAVAHGLTAPSYDAGTDTWSPGDTVIIRGHDATYVNLTGATVTLDGYFEVATTPDADTFTVFDPITGSTLALVAGGTGVGTVTKCVYTRNGVLIVMDYLWHEDGARLPRSMIEKAIDVWQEQADIADEAVDLKGSSATEARYSLSGGYEVPAPPKAVLPQMLIPMDARLNLRNDGAITIDVGRFVTPTVTLTDEHILDYAGLTRARPREELRNEIRSKYVSAALNYEEGDAEPWIDQASVDTDGLLTFQLDQLWCPSHAQARRRMKVESYRQNPTWSGKIVTNANGLRCIDQRFVHVVIAELGIDHDFEILEWGPFDLLSGNCPMTISAMPAEAYDWDAETEEGTAPINPDPPEGGTMPEPGGFGAIGDSGRIFATCDDPDRPDVSFYCEWRLHNDLVDDADAVWHSMVTDSQTEAHSGPLDFDFYDCRGQFTSISGAESAWVYVRDIEIGIPP